jgi:putative component of membrane protein insertase Oxa1/YidC/SpoIIIJ protein YidD
MGAMLLLIPLYMNGCKTMQVDDLDTPSSGGLIAFYQGPLNHLQAVRAGSCPMHPSCSTYARQALSKHGLILGGMMATDRLMRCGRDELRSAPRILVGGQVKYYDPLNANDFWLGNSQTSEEAAARFTHPPEALMLQPD